MSIELQPTGIHFYRMSECTAPVAPYPSQKRPSPLPLTLRGLAHSEGRKNHRPRRSLTLQTTASAYLSPIPTPQGLLMSKSSVCPCASLGLSFLICVMWGRTLSPTSRDQWEYEIMGGKHDPW